MFLMSGKDVVIARGGKMSVLLRRMEYYYCRGKRRDIVGIKGGQIVYDIGVHIVRTRGEDKLSMISRFILLRPKGDRLSMVLGFLLLLERIFLYYQYYYHKGLKIVKIDLGCLLSITAPLCKILKSSICIPIFIKHCHDMVLPFLLSGSYATANFHSGTVFYHCS